MVASAGRAKKRTEKGPSSPADPLWAAFSRRRSIANRNRLVEFYLPLVGYHAKRLHAKLPPAVELDDLVSAGNFGLMEAISAFDLSRGVRFETYSTTRIRGAMLDSLRDKDWVPRLVRSHSSKIIAATEELTQDGAVTDRKLAKRLGIKKTVLADWQRETSKIVQVTSLSTIIHKHHNCTEDDRLLDPQSFVTDPHQSVPGGAMLADDWWKAMLRCVCPVAKVVFQLYFRHHWTMKTIGKHVGLSESRVSQMMTAAIGILRKCRTRDDFTEITSRGNAETPKLLPLLAFCHYERLRKRRKPNNKQRHAS